MLSWHNGMLPHTGQRFLSTTGSSLTYIFWRRRWRRRHGRMGHALVRRPRLGGDVDRFSRPLGGIERRRWPTVAESWFVSLSASFWMLRPKLSGVVAAHALLAKLVLAPPMPMSFCVFYGILCSPPLPLPKSGRYVSLRRRVAGSGRTALAVCYRTGPSRRS